MDKYKQDPDPFTIGSLVIAGAALLLNLEQKIDTRNANEEQKNNEKAKARVTLNLFRITKYLRNLEKFWLYFAELGDNEIVNNEKNNEAYGASKKYLDLAEYEDFNDKLDEALTFVGKINKELYAIKLDDIYLDEKIRLDFIKKINELRQSLNQFLNYKLNIVDKLKAVQFNLNFAKEIVEELSLIVGMNISEATFNVNSLNQFGGEKYSKLQ